MSKKKKPLVNPARSSTEESGDELEVEVEAQEEEEEEEEEEDAPSDAPLERLGLQLRAIARGIGSQRRPASFLAKLWKGKGAGELQKIQDTINEAMITLEELKRKEFVAVEQTTAIAVREQELDTGRAALGEALVRARESERRAQEQLGTVDEARRHRDETQSKHGMLMAKICGFARSLGCPLERGDTDLAIRWLVENVKAVTPEGVKQDSAADLRLQHMSLLGDLEAAERESLETRSAQSFSDMISQWREQLGLQPPVARAPTLPLDLAKAVHSERLELVRAIDGVIAKVVSENSAIPAIRSVQSTTEEVPLDARRAGLPQAADWAVRLLEEVRESVNQRISQSVR